MPWTLERANLQYERALERLPLGVAADFGYRGAAGSPYVRRASGARLWDVEGNEYIDYRLAGGAVILGYADARIAEAVRGGIEADGARRRASEFELAVAERISHLLPCAERVRFASRISDAVSDALHSARAFTGKGAIAVVEGGFHGLPGMPRSRAGRRAAPRAVGAARRKRGPRRSSQPTIHILRANDANGFEELLRSRGDRIGALLVEPVPVDYASTAAAIAYFRDLRALCDRFEVVLVVDEVVTAFRAARGGAQQVVGVRADLCILGCTAANGFPFAALAGRAEIVRAIGDRAASPAPSAVDPVSLAAARTTLEIIEDTDAVERIAKYGWRMREGISQLLSRRGIAHAFVGPPSMSRLHFGGSTPRDAEDRSAAAERFGAELSPRLRGFGILCGADVGGPWFVSSAHNELCLAETLAKFEHAADAALERLSQARAPGADVAPRPPGPFAHPG